MPELVKSVGGMLVSSLPTNIRDRPSDMEM